MTDRTAQDRKYIIGFDLGDGESSMAIAEANSADEPVVFETRSGELSMITAVAVGDATYIGRDALTRGENEITELHLNFKADPMLDDKKWRTNSRKIRSFAEEFYLMLAEKHPDVAENAIVYIGHPSGWSVEGVERYRRLFEMNEHIKAEVHIVPESRAALIHVRDYRGVPEDVLESVLVVDIGSSTTDLTYVVGLDVDEIAVPESKTLGARLIDEHIMNTAIEMTANPAQWRETFQFNTKARDYVRYLARRIKEVKNGGDSLVPNAPDGIFRSLTETFWPLLEQIDVESMIHAPHPDLGLSWAQAFENLLVDARQHLGHEPKLVLLTGGGSHMAFTRAICERVFPTSRISPDPEPSFSVCRGLAGYGRWRYRVDAFRAAVEALITSESFRDAIEGNVARFDKAIGPKIVLPVLVENLRQIALGLRSKEITTIGEPDFIEKHYYGKLVEWLNSAEGRQKQDEINQQFLHPLETALNEDVRKLSEKFRMRYEVLKLSLFVEAITYFKISRRGDSIAEQIVRLLDHTIPGWARKAVPKFAVNLYFDVFDRFYRTLMNAANALLDEPTFTEAGRAKLVSTLHTQVREQLERGAIAAERLLLTPGRNNTQVGDS